LIVVFIFLVGRFASKETEMKSGIKPPAGGGVVKTGISGAEPPKRSGKIIPTQETEPSKPASPKIPDWDFEKKPHSIDPTKVLSVESIPELFRSIEKIMHGLSKLNAEFCIAGKNIPEIWIVPAYTAKNGKERHEMSFADAAKMVVLVAAFNGVVEEVVFLDEE